MFAIRNTFSSYERLKREQYIQALFRNGKAFSVFPIRTIFLWVERPITDKTPTKAGFSVPKKKFKKAVDRNRIKRLLRESWRTNKASLVTTVPNSKQLHVFLIFSHNELLDFQAVDSAMKKVVERLKDSSNA